MVVILVVVVDVAHLAEQKVADATECLKVIHQRSLRDSQQTLGKSCASATLSLTAVQD